jgi:hypothetical protein
VYYRLADTPPVDVAKNSGSLGATGNGIHGPGVIHRTAGALTANGNASAGYDGSVEYLRLDEPFTGANIAANKGSLGIDGDGTHFPGLVHQAPGALAGDSDTAARYFGIDESSDDGAVPTRVPFNAALNTSTFSFEVWAKPTADGLGNAQLVLYNRKEGGVRTGWNLYQRGSGVGWNLRMYDGVDDQRSIDITGGPYTIGQWYHF